MKHLLVAGALGTSGLALAGCVQYGGYNPSYVTLWNSATAGYAASGGAESDRIAINQCGVDGTWGATWSTSGYTTELSALDDQGQAALIRLDSCHGANPPGYSSFAADVVTKAAAIVPIRAVQIWSEPNFAVQWNGTIDAAGYAKMFKSAYTAIKSAANVPVITAGLAPVHQGHNSCPFNDSKWMCPHDYLNKLLSKLKSMHVQADGLGENLFPIQTSAITTDSALADIKSEYNSFDSVDQKFGTLPIWVTETGVKTNANVSGSQQGAIMKTYGDWLVNQNDLVALYVWMLIDDNSGNPNYGVLTTSGTPKGGSSGAYCQAAAERGVTPAGC